MRKVWVGVFLAAVASPCFAGGDSLVDVLRQKGILTADEAKQLDGKELPPATRDNLIEVLRAKGVLSTEEAAKLAPAAPPSVMPAVAPTPEQSPAVAVAAAPPAPTPKPLVSYEEGFVIRTQDDKYSLRFNGRVNELFVFQQPGTTQNSTMFIDRARLSVDGTFYKQFRMRLEAEFAANTSILRDAFVAWSPLPEAGIVFGQYKVPFAYESLLSSRYIPFTERAAVVRSTVDPQRDIGVMLQGQFGLGVLAYQVSLMNGAGQDQRDNNSAKDVVARVFLTPMLNGNIEALKGLSFGGAFTYGLQPIDSDSIEGLTDYNFVFYPDVPVNGYRQRYDMQVAWLYGPATATGELIFTNEARDDLGADGSDLAPLKTNGAYIGGTYMLTGETKPFNRRVHPAHPFLWPVGEFGWGAWEAALRYEYFDLQHTPDSPDDFFPRNRYDAVLAGVNWYPNEFTRLTVDYVYAHFLETGLGLSPDPDKHSDNVVMGRAQIEF